MVRDKISLVAGIALFLALVSVAQPGGRWEGGPPPTMVAAPVPQPPGGPGPMPMRMRELADQLRARAREAQELSDRLRRQADELDQAARRMMEQGPGPQRMGQVKQELDEIKGAIDRAEREGRYQEAQELRRRAEQLMGRFQPLPPGPGMDERQEIKRQIERLRDEARRAKDQGRVEDSERIWKEADRLEQKLREPGPGGDERQQIKWKIEALRNEARQAKEQGRYEDAERLGDEANRLEKQLREQRPRDKGEFSRPMPPEVLEILRAAEQAEREGRMDDARRQREKAEIVARQLQEQKGRAPEPDRSFKEDIMRSLGGLKQEIGRLWQAVNEMRNRPREERPL